MDARPRSDEADATLGASDRRRRLCVAAAVLLMLLLAGAVLLWPADARAGVPNDQAVPAYAEEQTILQLQQGQREPGLGDAQSGIEHGDRHTLVPPGRLGEYGVIVQRGGNTWRTLRNGPLATGLAALLLVTVLAIAAFHLTHRPPPEPAAPGRQLLRFTRWQRGVHWAAAIAFVVLGLSGLLLSFGKLLLLPVLGHDAYALVALAGKWSHNVAGPLFVVASVVMFATYLRHNHFERADATWLLRAGGMLSGKHVPAPYFNAGEKLWFWVGVTALGVVMAVSGLMLDFPYLGDVGMVTALTRYQLQGANVVHIVGAALYGAAALGHIYLGTLGSPGAWRAMAHGTVSEHWARTHHRLWHEQVRQAAADGRSAPPLDGRAAPRDPSRGAMPPGAVPPAAGPPAAVPPAALPGALP